MPAPGALPISGDGRGTYSGGGYYGGGYVPPMPPPPIYNPPPIPPPPTPEPLQLSAQEDPNLVGLGNDYKKYISDLQSGTGRIMDIAGSRLRDAREGGRKALSEDAAMRGVDDSKLLEDYDTETQGGVSKALADITTDRERTLGGALQGGVSVFGAPKQLALQEKGLGLQAWQANNAASNQSWQNILSLINARNLTQPPLPQYGGYY